MVLYWLSWMFIGFAVAALVFLVVRAFYFKRKRREQARMDWENEKEGG